MTAAATAASTAAAAVSAAMTAGTKAAPPSMGSGVRGRIERTAIITVTPGTVIPAVQYGTFCFLGAFERNGFQLFPGKAESGRIDQIFLPYGRIRDYIILAEFLALQEFIETSPSGVFILAKLCQQYIFSCLNPEKDGSGDAYDAQEEETAKGKI